MDGLLRKNHFNLKCLVNELSVPEKRSPYERQRIDACAAHDMRGDVSSNPGETRILTARDY